jgi:inner membrane protein YhjD
VNPAERAIRAIDRTQQRWGPSAFLYGVIRKFGDDRGGNLAALLTFYGFLSLFPLLLLLVTVLALVGGGDHSLVHRVEASAFSDFPLVGSKLSANIHELHRASALGMVIGIVGVAWGSQGAIQTAQYVQAEVWNVPGAERPNYWTRILRTFLMVLVVGAFLLATTGLAAFATIGKHGPLASVAAAAGTVLLNIALFAIAFRVLTPKHAAWKALLPGAMVGGVGWTVIQYLGGVLVDHTLRHASPVYGFFAEVLGLIAWIFLGARLSVYAAEVNVVAHRHLWPRSMVQPPFTHADKRVLSDIVLQSKRRPEQQVSTGYDADRTTA